MIIEKDEKLVIVNSLRRNVLLIMLGLIMTTLSVLYLISEKDWLSTIIGIIGVLFSGFATIYCIYSAITKKELVIFDKNGITDNSSAVSIWFIPWNDIGDIWIRIIGNQKFISLTLYNEDMYLEQLSWIKKALLSANKRSGFWIVNITLVGTGIDIDKLYQKISKYIEDNVKNRQK